MKIRIATILSFFAVFVAVVTVQAADLIPNSVIQGKAKVFSFQSSDDGLLNIRTNCVTDATDSGASTQVLTAVIPAKAVSLGVTCTVNTIIAGTSLTTWSLGDGVDADLYGTTLALAAGTTVTSANYTASPLTQSWGAAAKDLTMTAAAGQFDSGNVTCCSYYLNTTQAVQ